MYQDKLCSISGCKFSSKWQNSCSGHLQVELKHNSSKEIDKREVRDTIVNTYSKTASAIFTAYNLPPGVFLLL